MNVLKANILRYRQHDNVKIPKKIETKTFININLEYKGGRFCAFANPAAHKSMQMSNVFIKIALYEKTDGLKSGFARTKMANTT